MHKIFPFCFGCTCT